MRPAVHGAQEFKSVDPREDCVNERREAVAALVLDLQQTPVGHIQVGHAAGGCCFASPDDQPARVQQGARLVVAPWPVGGHVAAHPVVLSDPTQ